MKTAKIKELINVELPVIEVAETSTDFIFLLEDNTYLHFEFQTSYNKKDITRFAMYDLRLYERDKREITTVIIYPATVKKANTDFTIGSLQYHPEKIMLYEYDGNAIFGELEAKIKEGKSISDVDMLNLIFLPLMRNTIPKEELAIKSIQLAQTIPDDKKRNTCMASVFAFASQHLEKKELNKLLEVLRMGNLLTKAIEDAIESTVEDAVTEEKREIAKNLLKEGITMEFVIKVTKLDESTIEQLQEELNNE